ncbi:MAG: hypothetical protein GY951_06760, partial [Psychromonas sp.]|nr:hypothetical protein [Psychromonas sp.]
MSLIIFVPPVFAISDADSDGVIDSSDVDVDGDGLIEITTLEQLYNIRNNLSGTAYNDGSGDDSTGCGNNVDILACNGYELSNDLDFDTNADGVMGANDAYWNDGEGWEPIGDESAPFSALLHGNDFTISNLYIDRSSATHLGLFSTTYGATIQNISLAGDLMSI